MWAEEHLEQSDPFRRIDLPRGGRPDLSFDEWRNWKRSNPEKSHGLSSRESFRIHNGGTAASAGTRDSWRGIRYAASAVVDEVTERCWNCRSARSVGRPTIGGQQANTRPVADSVDIADLALENGELCLVVEYYSTSDGHGDVTELGSSKRPS